jgi:glucosylceramidase
MLGRRFPQAAREQPPMLKIFPASLALAALLSLSALAQETADFYLTAPGGARIDHQGQLRFAPLDQPQEWMPTVIVDPKQEMQTLEGIGGALTDASAETFYKLAPQRRQQILKAYYDPVQGIGYTLGRTHINSCDFSSQMYAYDQTPGDTSLSRFSVEHDEKARIPFIREVLKVAPDLKLFASPWSPPAWMKTNADMLHGGKLKPECRQAWARYYVRFVEEYEKRGIPIWGLTVQNEPMASQTWESCIYTAEEERDFVRDHLGPALQAAGLGRLKLMIWDHNRGLAYQRASTAFRDPEAAKYIWGTAFHWYVGDQYENLGQVHEAFPDKAILFSEGCCDSFHPETVHDWKWGEVYARSMIHDFNNWTCGWTDWNVLLDERGGPNHVGNFCFAPIIADTATGELTFMSSYYYIGHFSKFLRPGARRLACTVNNQDLLATSFRNVDGRAATVVMNQGEKDLEVKLWLSGRAATARLPAHSIATLVCSL